MLPLEHSAILLTCIKRQLVLKTNFGLFESGGFTQVLLHLICPCEKAVIWLCKIHLDFFPLPESLSNIYVKVREKSVSNICVLFLYH